MPFVCDDPTKDEGCGDPMCQNCDPVKRREAISAAIARGDMISALFDCRDGQVHLFATEEEGVAYANETAGPTREHMLAFLDELRVLIQSGDCNGVIVTCFSQKTPGSLRGCSGIIPGSTAARWPETAQFMQNAIQALQEARAGVTKN